MQGQGRSFGRIVAVERLASVLFGFAFAFKSFWSVDDSMFDDLTAKFVHAKGSPAWFGLLRWSQCLWDRPQGHWVHFHFAVLPCVCVELINARCNRMQQPPFCTSYCVLAELCSFQDCKLGAWGAWSACNANVTQQRPMAMARGSKDVKLPCASEYFCCHSYQLLNSSLEFLKVPGKEDVEFKFFRP